MSLSLAEKVAIALLTVATAAPTEIKGPSEAANEAPNPFAAVEAVVNEAVAPLAEFDKVL